MCAFIPSIAINNIYSEKSNSIWEI